MIELLYFSGEHCGVCKVLKPKLIEQVSTHFPEVKINIIDVQQEQALAAQHLVFTLPVVLIMVEGKEQYRFARSFSVMEVLDKLERLENLINQ
ncbi:thioredoxin family protein [Pontimicrobium sp. IMCC45349]|uniref:thioredoxin family protein n=1 Tax=Pontimicrobium sp. IMCC45349 TaxID=3391574 RepID=UPI0039A309CD